MMCKRFKPKGLKTNHKCKIDKQKEGSIESYIKLEIKKIFGSCVFCLTYCFLEKTVPYPDPVWVKFSPVLSLRVEYKAEKKGINFFDEICLDQRLVGKLFNHV